MAGSHRRDGQDPAAEPSKPTSDVSADVEFTPRTGARRFVGVLLLATVCGLAVAAYLAFRDANPVTVGVTCVLLVVMLGLWGLRASSPVAHLAVRSGQLEVTQGGRRFVFDLSGGYTPIQVVGSPGDRDWRVLFLRRNEDPFVVDSSMVDPHEFMDALHRYLPD